MENRMTKEHPRGPIQIDKQIPIPEKRAGVPQMCPWAKMDVGDSFLLNAKTGANASAACRVAGQRNAPRKFTYRTTAEGYRVWRVA